MNTHIDLKKMVELHIQQEMTRALAMTESLSYVVGQMFGGKKGSQAPSQQLGSADEMMDFARRLNG